MGWIQFNNFAPDDSLISDDLKIPYFVIESLMSLFEGKMIKTKFRNRANDQAHFRWNEQEPMEISNRVLFHQMKPWREIMRNSSHKSIFAVFEFTTTGYLKAIYLNAESDRDQRTCVRSLSRLFKARHFSWLKMLFRR